MAKNRTITAAAWHAIGKVAEKEGRRDDLKPGSYPVELQLVGTVRKSTIETEISGELHVGTNSTQNKPSSPNLADVVPQLLARMSPAARRAVLAELPRLFKRAAKRPPVPDEVARDAETLLKRLRSTKKSRVRGAVTCNYELNS